MTDEDLSPETRALLDRGRHGHALSEGHRRGLKRAVLANVAAGTVMATSTTAAAWTTSVLNAASVGVLVLFVGGGIHAALTTNAAPLSPHVSDVAKATRPTGKETRVGPRVLEAQKPEVAMPASAALPTPPPEPVIAATPSAAPASPSPGTRAAVARVPDSPRGKSPTTRSAAPPPAPAADVPEEPVRAPVSVAVSSASLEAEARLLREADRALKGGDAAGCLRLLDEHARQFPSGVLEPERSAERVLALCSAGRAVDAQGAARTLLATHASGPQASRVRASCAGPGL